MKTCLHLLFATFFLAVIPVHAATQEDPEHAELRAIKDALVTAFNQRDEEGFLRHMHPNVVATWQNAEVSRGPEGIRAFMKKMTEGETKRVQSVQAKVEVDELASLYGDKKTALAFGSVAQDFKFFDGQEIAIKSRWTATFLKVDGRWLLAAIHVSANVFDNPVLTLAVRKTAIWSGLGALPVGGLVGWIAGRRRRAAAQNR
jgi:uncharacterized protein (TIGR02246 family)